MKRIVLAFGILTLASSAHGQDSLQGFSASVDFLNLKTAGADIDQVQVFTLRDSTEAGGTLTQRTATSDYGGDFRAIDMGIGTDQTFLWSAGYRRRNWGVVVRRWTASGDVSYSERIVSPPPTIRLGPATSLLSRAVSGCRMWDHSLVPVEDVREPSGFAPVDCHAGNELDVSKMDMMLERVWIDETPFRAVVRVGASLGTLEHRRAEGQEQNAFLTSAGLLVGPPVDRFTNRVTLDGTGEATGVYWGPNVELAGRFGFKRVFVDWRANQALLIGETELTGEWVDIDRINVTGRIGNVPTTESAVTEGRYPFGVEKRTVVPVLDVYVKGGYQILSALSAGVGFFASSWLGVPLAPSWSVPGVWTDEAGSHWRQNEANLAFYGFSVFGQVGF